MEHLHTPANQGHSGPPEVARTHQKHNLRHPIQRSRNILPILPLPNLPFSQPPHGHVPLPQPERLGQADPTTAGICLVVHDHTHPNPRSEHTLQRWQRRSRHRKRPTLYARTWERLPESVKNPETLDEEVTRSCSKVLSRTGDNRPTGPVTPQRNTVDDECYITFLSKTIHPT